MPARAPASRFVAIGFLENRSRRQWTVIWSIVAVFVVRQLTRTLAAVTLDRWWYDTVTEAGVWGTRVSAQAQLVIATALLVAAVLGSSVWLVLRFETMQTAPLARPIERYHQRMGRGHRWLLVGIVVFFTYRIGTASAEHWQEYLLFRHSFDVGADAPVVGGDIGFHLFRLPFITSAIVFLRQLLLFTLAIAAAGHLASGALRTPKRATHVSRLANAHLAMLVAGLLAVQALYDVLVARPSLATDSVGTFDGPGWTARYVLDPGLLVCALATVIAAFAAVWMVRTGSWRPLAIATSVAAVAQLGVVWIAPAITERVVVAPAEAERQLWAIDDNLAATRMAYELSGIENEGFDNPPLADAADAGDVVLFDASTMAAALQVLVGTTGTRVGDSDLVAAIGAARPVYVAPRSANRADLPESGWVQSTMVYTHGDGVVAASATSTSEDGRPLLAGDDAGALSGHDSTPLYFDPALADWYAIVGTHREQEGGAVFDGDGVGLGSLGRRVVTALALGEPQIALSGELTTDSELVYRRAITERVGALAPFLTLDSDPYVVADGDQLLWVVDGFTTTSHYPASQFADTSTLPASSPLTGATINAMRDSVRVTVDAETGDTHLYRIDGGDDPLIEVWDRVFPDLLEDEASMPEAVAAQSRYPGDLWRIQSQMLGRYHVDSAEALFSGEERWAVSAAPSASVGDTTIAPSAPVDQISGSDDTFASVIPYGPGSATNPTSTREELSAFATAMHGSSRIVMLARTEEGTVLSPRVAQSAIDADPELAREIALLTANGSQVVYGPMTPLADREGVVWVRPILVVGAGSGAVPRLYGVAAVRDGNVNVAPTAEEAVQRLSGVSGSD